MINELTAVAVDMSWQWRGPVLAGPGSGRDPPCSRHAPTVHGRDLLGSGQDLAVDKTWRWTSTCREQDPAVDKTCDSGQGRHGFS